MSVTVFIAGSHTDVGKTHVACGLLRAAHAAGLSAAAFKPVVSGLDPTDWAASDPGRLLTALGCEPTPEALQAVSPLRFRASLAPPMAARLEGVRLELSALVENTLGWLSRTPADLRLVEGAGGLMSPIAEGATGLDLMLALDLPSVLVGGSYLGAISHTLTALEVMRARRVPVAALAISESADPAAPNFQDTLASIGEFAGPTPVIAVPRGSDAAWGRDLLAAMAAGG